MAGKMDKEQNRKYLEQIDKIRKEFLDPLKGDPIDLGGSRSRGVQGHRGAETAV